MPMAVVHFHACQTDSQDYGSDNEHMISRVFFSVAVDAKQMGDFWADLKQSVGTDIEAGDIEVGHPQGYMGPWNHDAFADAARSYYRQLVGAQGRAIRVEGASSFRMRDCRFQREYEVQFPIRAVAEGW